MRETNYKYSWKELKAYLEGFVKHKTDLCMSDPDFSNDPDIRWTRADACMNSIENLKESVDIIFGRFIDSYEEKGKVEVAHKKS